MINHLLLMFKRIGRTVVMSVVTIVCGIVGVLLVLKLIKKAVFKIIGIGAIIFIASMILQNM